MKLIPVHSCDDAEQTLYDLLLEREAYQSISHTEMPSMDEHYAFIASQPYLAWYIITIGFDRIGATYLTNQREIGIGIFKEFQGNGYGTTAVNFLMKHHPGKFLANINPNNTASIHLFGKLGFKHIQQTYAL